MRWVGSRPSMMMASRCSAVASAVRVVMAGRSFSLELDNLLGERRHVLDGFCDVAGAEREEEGGHASPAVLLQPFDDLLGVATAPPPAASGRPLPPRGARPAPRRRRGARRGGGPPQSCPQSRWAGASVAWGR